MLKSEDMWTFTINRAYKNVRFEIIQKLLARENFDLLQVRTSVFDLELDDSNRKKRAIGFLGDFFQWCCGTALQSDLVNTNENVVRIE